MHFAVDKSSGDMALTNEEAFLINIIDILGNDLIFCNSVGKLDEIQHIIHKEHQGEQYKLGKSFSMDYRLGLVVFLINRLR